MGCALESVFVEDQIKGQNKQGQHNEQIEVIGRAWGRQFQCLPEYVYFRDIKLGGNLKKFAVKVY